MKAAARQTPEAYRNTSVSAHRTRDEIERVLLRYGADGVAWHSVRSPQGAAVAVRFRRADRVYRFHLDMGTDARDERQRMRALYWGLKAMLEQAEFGILAFQDVFLAFSEVALPDGRTATVGEIIQGQLARQQVPSLEAGLRALPAPEY